jgi:hypothetical protein
MTSNYFIHGNAVTVAERPGGGNFGSAGDLENIFGIAWTDIVGLRSGPGTSFRGKGGKFIWFHIPFPTPVVVNDRPSDMSRLEVLFDIDGNAAVDSVHMWTSDNQRWFVRDNLGLTSSWLEDFPPNSILGGVISISIGVNFREAANITFRGVGLTLR